MKFTKVEFSEDTEFNARGEVFELEEGESYEFPLFLAQQMVEGEPAYESHSEPYEVPNREVADRFGTVADEDAEPEDDEPEEETGERDKFDQILEDHTVPEMREIISDVDSYDYLEELYKRAERKGVNDAVRERLGELDDPEDESTTPT